MGVDCLTGFLNRMVGQLAFYLLLCAKKPDLWCLTGSIFSMNTKWLRIKTFESPKNSDFVSIPVIQQMAPVRQQLGWRQIFSPTYRYGQFCLIQSLFRFLFDCLRTVRQLLHHVRHVLCTRLNVSSFPCYLTSNFRKKSNLRKWGQKIMLPISMKFVQQI